MSAAHAWILYLEYKMFNPVESTFVYDGDQYVVKRTPRRFWPCQSCDLADQCCEHIGDKDWPRCRRGEREDGTDVVFFRTFSQGRRK